MKDREWKSHDLFIKHRYTKIFIVSLHLYNQNVYAMITARKKEPSNDKTNHLERKPISSEDIHFLFVSWAMVK